MNGLFKDIKKDRVIFTAFLASFILVFISVVYILFSYRNLPPFLPIYNQLPWGNDRIGTTITIFIPEALVFFISILNLIIFFLLYKKIQIVSRMLSATSLLVALLSFLFTIRTIQLVL